MQTARLIKKQGRYRARMAVTTDPKAKVLDEAKKGQPVRVDPQRFAAWESAGFLELDTLEGGEGKADE